MPNTIFGNSVPIGYNQEYVEKYNNEGPSVDGVSENNSLFMFSHNNHSPDCCYNSPYSTSTGCVCMSDNQFNYLANRGGNN